MTPTHPLSPERDADDLALQLNLFSGLASEHAVVERGVSRAIARASISPGWWRLVANLYDGYANIIVKECREHDAALILRVVDRDGSPMGDIVRHICDSAEQMCGACGSAPATPYRARLDTPTLRVCPRCRDRLRNGEAYLTIADEFWALDGSRRVVARVLGDATWVKRKQPLSATTANVQPLPGPELRRLITDIRLSMRSEIIGNHNDDAVSALALLAGLHVGGGLARGSRTLILGPSGSGKSSAIAAMLHAVSSFQLPVVTVDCVDLTSPGWSGAASIGRLIEASIGGDDDTTSFRAQHCIVVLDELHHLALRNDTTGNTAAHHRDVMTSFLGLTGHGTIQFEDGRAWSSQHALVIGMGAFTDLLDYRRPVTVRELSRSLPLELVTRIAEQTITLRAPTERDMLAILREWPALKSLISVCERLGYEVRVHDEAVRRAARVVQLGHDRSTLRSAGGWLVSALRQGLIDALEQSETREIVVSPDSLPIPPTATRPEGPQEPPERPRDGEGGDLPVRR